MNCERALTLMHGYLDNELDLLTSLNLEPHLDSCEQCRKALHELRHLQNEIRHNVSYHHAPDSLRARLEKPIHRPDGKNKKPAWFQPVRNKWPPSRWLASCALVLLAANLGLYWLQPSRLSRLSEEIVSSHVRSLMSDHLTDVTSSDKHTVKPWFSGKLDFSPTVIDLTGQGFTLVGGRLDYIAAHPVTALVYRRRQHLINVFIWPANAGDKPVEYSDTRNGYNLVAFKARNMNYWIISDLNATELMAFKKLLLSKA